LPCASLPGRIPYLLRTFTCAPELYIAAANASLPAFCLACLRVPSPHTCTLSPHVNATQSWFWFSSNAGGYAKTYSTCMLELLSRAFIAYVASRKAGGRRRWRQGWEQGRMRGVGHDLQGSRRGNGRKPLPVRRLTPPLTLFTFFCPPASTPY